ncbi:unnamed protein product, partial [Mesorhabditis spiculigera]
MKQKLGKIQVRFSRRTPSTESRSSATAPAEAIQFSDPPPAVPSSASMATTSAAYIPQPTDIDVHEAINDSPRFRGQARGHEAYFNRLESRLTEILKHFATMADLGRTYATTVYKLSISVNQLGQESFPDNALAQSTFGTLAEAYTKIVELMRGFQEESTINAYNKLQMFCRKELADVAALRTQFDNTAALTDDALTKNAASSRTKKSETLETRNALVNVGALHAHTALDFLEKINLAHAQKDLVVVDALWSFVKDTSAFFSKGHAFFDEWTAMDNGGIADAVDALTKKRDYTARQMQDIHSLVPSEMYQHPPGISLDPDVVMEGYLYKRSSNAFKTWNRRWFQIKDNKLLYIHRSGDDFHPTVMEKNLVLCIVRPAPTTIDRIGCFELVTPERSHILQADSEAVCNAWMRALQRTILNLHEASQAGYDAIRNEPSSSAHQAASESHSGTAMSGRPTTITEIPGGSPRNANGTEPVYTKIRRTPGNDRCADCGGREDVKWVSINLGVVLCIECCGVHRSLGVQVSKIRSLTMDSLDGEVTNILMSLGNDRVNAILLSGLPKKDIVPPPANERSPREVRETWIKAKYVERRFVAHGTPHKALRRKASAGVNRSASSANVASLDMTTSSTYNENLGETHSDEGGDEGHADVHDELLLAAARTGDLPEVLKNLLTGADVNALVDGTTALHAAILANHTAVVEFLLLNGAKTSLADANGDTPLHVASRNDGPLAAAMLLKRGVDRDLVNLKGETPIQIAVDKESVEIITLLRLHEMRDETDATEGVDEIISDLTRRAAEKAATMRNGAAGRSPPSISELALEKMRPEE